LTPELSLKRIVRGWGAEEGKPEHASRGGRMGKWSRDNLHLRKVLGGRSGGSEKTVGDKKDRGLDFHGQAGKEARTGVISRREEENEGL